MNDERRTLGYHHEERRRKVLGGRQSYNEPPPRYPVVVAVPEWLSPGARIQSFGGRYATVLVLAVDGSLTIVEGADSVWPIDTAIVVECWEVTP